MEGLVFHCDFRQRIAVSICGGAIRGDILVQRGNVGLLHPPRADDRRNRVRWEYVECTH